MSIHGRNIMILQFTMNNIISMVQQIHICYIKQKSWKHWCYCYWKRKQSDYVNQHICICYFISNKRWNNNFGCNWSSKVVFVSNETKYFEDDKDTTDLNIKIEIMKMWIKCFALSAILAPRISCIFVRIIEMNKEWKCLLIITINFNIFRVTNLNWTHNKKKTTSCP